MTWIARMKKGIVMDTHYYCGLTSACRQSRLDDVATGGGNNTNDGGNAIQFVSYNTTTVRYCGACRGILKTEKMQKDARLTRAKVEMCQKRLQMETGIDITIQDMIMRYLTHCDTKTPVPIQDLRKLLEDYCPRKAFEDVMVQMVTSGRITLFDGNGAVSPALEEEPPIA